MDNDILSTCAVCGRQVSEWAEWTPLVRLCLACDQSGSSHRVADLCEPVGHQATRANENSGQ